MTKDSSIINPTACQLSQMVWSVVWRYVVISTVVVLIFYGFYLLNLEFTIRFMNFARHMGELVTSIGYSRIIGSYPLETFLWFFMRFLGGLIITYWVFTQLVTLTYCSFKLSMGYLSENHSYWRGILSLSWSFYWRLYISLMTLYLGSIIIFMNPNWLISHIPLITVYFIFLGAVVMFFVFKRIVNKPFCGYTLQVSKTGE